MNYVLDLTYIQVLYDLGEYKFDLKLIKYKNQIKTIRIFKIGPLFQDVLVFYQQCINLEKIIICSDDVE